MLTLGYKSKVWAPTPPFKYVKGKLASNFSFSLYNFLFLFFLILCCTHKLCNIAHVLKTWPIGTILRKYTNHLKVFITMNL